MKVSDPLNRISWMHIITPLTRVFRRRRLRALVDAFPDLADSTVVDIGGSPHIWALLQELFGLQPKTLVLVNLSTDLRFAGPHDLDYRLVVADGTNLPFTDRSFDLAFTNSVIEHVGDERAMAAFARECQRVGRRLYLQTPNHWFPVEPHLVTVGIHWLPRSLYRRLSFLSLFYLLYGWRSSDLRAAHYREFDNTRLLTGAQLGRLLPGKVLGRERFLGLTKSFVVTDR